MLDYSRHNDPQAFSGGCSTQRETRCACTACKQRNIEHRRAQIERQRTRSGPYANALELLDRATSRTRGGMSGR